VPIKLFERLGPRSSRITTWLPLSIVCNITGPNAIASAIPNACRVAYLDTRMRLPIKFMVSTLLQSSRFMPVFVAP
jgi:hypothetical protein